MKRNTELKKSVRVQMGPDTENFLEALAQDYGCIHGTKGSISKLLDSIAHGYLFVSKTPPPRTDKLRFPTNGSKHSEKLIAKLKIKVPFRDLSGIIYTISNSIGTSKGNILDIESVHENNGQVSNYSFLISISLKQLKQLLNRLNDEKISNLKDFNGERELEEQKILTQYIHPLEDFLEQKIFTEVRCIVGLNLVTENKIGVFANITHEIAKQRGLVESIEQHFNASENRNTVNLFLEATPRRDGEVNDYIGQIENIKIALNDKSKFPDIIEHVNYISDGEDFFKKR